MTKEEFLEELVSLREEGWNIEISEIGGIRLKTPGFPSYIFCPITAVCYKKTDRAIAMTNYLNAALVINLPQQTTKLIACAADNTFDLNPKTDEIYKNSIRAELFKALNLPLEKL